MKYHCAKCKRAWATWSEPKRRCNHGVLTFGCPDCVKFKEAMEQWNFFHSDDFKVPKCGECGAYMILCDYERNKLEFGCPKTDRGGDMWCDEEKGYKIVEVK